jgi:hypothetical protein
MVSQLRLALLIGAITAVAVSPVRAGLRAPRCCDNPCGPSAGTSTAGAGATAPAFRTVTCTEWVRENYTTKRTTYKVECRTECYDTFRCERVPVCKERTVSCVKRVPVWTDQCRKVCHHVTTYEERVVNKTCYKTVQETCMQKQLVRLGHWECREVCGGGLLGGGHGGGGGLFSGHGHGRGCNSGCNDSCGNGNGSNACNDNCRPARTRKVWVNCPEYRECPVTVCKKVCYTEAVKCKVAVCRPEWREEKVKVCTYQCVTENRVVKETCWETRKVPCKATRTVRVCVPCEETVTCCRMVPRTVTRQVPCAPACETTSACCESRFGGGLFRHGGGGRLRGNSDCGGHNRGCGNNCGGGCH